MPSIKIGPILYNLREISRLTDETQTAKLAGHIKYDTSEILLEASLEDQAKLQVLWHEIIHGILTHAGIDNIEERTVDVLAYGVLSVLVDNPGLRTLSPPKS